MQDDKLFKNIAETYTERYGQELRAEMEQLGQYPAASIFELNLERRVRKAIAGKKRRPYYISTIATLAACFALAFIFLFSNRQGLFSFNQYDSGGGMAETATTGSSSADSADVAESVPEDSSMWEPEYSEPRESAPTLSEDPAPEVQVFDVIPLSAPLPDGFTQVGFEQDYGKSIYYIEDIYNDDVVITLEKIDTLPDTSELTEITLGNLTAFGTQTDAYNLLTFTVDDVQYTLTSEHDINTLVRLGYAFA